MQYLDDILVVGKHKQEVHMVTNKVTATLRKAGFLIGAKSILTPIAEATWTGKAVNAQAGRIHPAQAGGGGGLRGEVGAHGGGSGDQSVPQASVGPLGVAWQARQHGGGILEWGARVAALWGARVAALWATVGAHSAAQPGHGRLGGSLLRAAWVGADLYPKHLHKSPQPVCGRCTRARWVGIWKPNGPWIRRCPRWVTSQQSAELWDILAGLERARLRDEGIGGLIVESVSNVGKRWSSCGRSMHGEKESKIPQTHNFQVGTLVRCTKDDETRG